MLYRENGQFKTSYRADQQIFPILQDRWAIGLLVAAAFLLVPMLASDYMFRAILIPFLILALAALGVNILVGYCGQISLGSGAFMAVGAYGAYNFFVRVPDMPLVPAVLLGGLCATAFGILFGAVFLAVFQAAGIAIALQNQGAGGGIPVVYNPGPGFVLTAVVSLTAGTMFLMWLGEQVTERGIGNGVSLIIFAGIVAGLPSAAIGMFEQVRNGEMSTLLALAIVAIVLAVTYFVVFVERGQRRITVNYARRQGGRSAYMNQSSFLPLKLNMSGVIPPIFASSIVMFPATAAAWFGQGDASSKMLQVSQWLSPGEPLHMILYGGLIAGFAFFYTALVFNSQETADNLKKSGALIPGIRPGKATADYVDAVLTRLTAAGAAYLVLVCLLPEVMRSQMGISFYFGGTSLLIVVVVVMDFIAQIQAHLMSHQYESLLKKANLKGSRAGR